MTTVVAIASGKAKVGKSILSTTRTGPVDPVPLGFCSKLDKVDRILAVYHRCA